MPLQATSGAASYDAFGGGVPVVPNYIEEVFSTWLYTGTGASQTITNGIDLSTKGGLVWIKARTNGSGVSSFGNNQLSDTALGLTNSLCSNDTSSYTDNPQTIDSVSSTGFVTSSNARVAYSGNTYASWTFRKQPKFFDVVTYTGTGSNTTISHSLGSVPACIMVKRTDTTGDWQVYHRSLANTEYLVLNSTAAKATGATRWNSTTPTSTVFSLGTDATVNASGGTYVAYIFAHDAGGFGLTGTDNVISCGSYDGNSTSLGPQVDLGYEPQWVIIKGANEVSNWVMFDNMRGVTTGGNDSYLRANSTATDNNTANLIQFNATGFRTENLTTLNNTGSTYIYIAIRRGPMKVPTSGTSVFGLSARTGTGANATVTGDQIDDAVIVKNRGSAVASLFSSRLTGTGYLVTSSTAAEVAAGTTILQANPWDVMDGVKVGTTSTITNASANTFINYLFKRAPSFFDVVCYTGNGSYPFTINHNLGVVPELIIFKTRNSAEDWWTYAKPILSPNANWYQNYMILNGTLVSSSDTTAITSTPTSTTIPIASFFGDAGKNYVVYLFATCAGVSKVGSYTGNGTTQTINCGFGASGARFVLIKRTDSTGEWYVYDTARGMTALTDPYLRLNNVAAETATLGSVTTVSTGFALNSAILAAINVNTGTYIFLAIA